MNVSCIVCVCVCVRLLAVGGRGGAAASKTNPTEQKTKIKEQNGIIMADILKNETETQTVQRLWYYSDNKATFSRWVLSCLGFFFSFSKRFLLLLLQMATERRREGWRKRWSRDGEEAIGPVHSVLLVHTASTFLWSKQWKQTRCLTHPRSSLHLSPSVCQNKGGTRHRR